MKGFLSLKRGGGGGEVLPFHWTPCPLFCLPANHLKRWDLFLDPELSPLPQHKNGKPVLQKEFIEKTKKRSLLDLRHHKHEKADLLKNSSELAALRFYHKMALLHEDGQLHSVLKKLECKKVKVDLCKFYFKVLFFVHGGTVDLKVWSEGRKVNLCSVISSPQLNAKC